MSQYLLVALAAAFAAGLTLYSGFGLGTLLLPVFALFFPVEVAVAATAVVHGANNVFKVSLVGRYADRDTVLRFGLAAITAAIIGASALGLFATLEPIARWELAGREAVVTPLKVLMGILMLGFALFELLPGLREFNFRREHFILGGAMSGFFGGLSGHQGALRSAFLVKAGLETEGFVGTSAVIGLMVDVVRIAVYAIMLALAGEAVALGADSWPMVVTGCLAAFVGVLTGKQFLHRVKISAVQTLTGIMLFLIALLLASGLI